MMMYILPAYSDSRSSVLSDMQVGKIKIKREYCMYKRKSDGWMKHFDFLLLDMVCLQIAFLLSFLILGRHVNPYADPLYRNMALILEVMDLTVMILFGTLSGVLKKGYYRDFVITVQHGAILGADYLC